MISFYPDLFTFDDDFFNQLKDLKLRTLPLRKVDGMSLLEVEFQRHQEVYNLMEKNKLKISFVEFDFKYDLNHILPYKTFFPIANIYQTNMVVINLPFINDFNIEKEQLTTTLTKMINDAKASKIDLVFHIDCEIQSSVVAYLVSEIDDILFYFDPSCIYLSDKSISSYYRLIADNLRVVSLQDYDEEKEATLLGYGECQIIDTIDKLTRDRFRGYVVYDFNLTDYIDRRLEAYKTPFFKKFVGRKRRKAHKNMDHKLKIDETHQLSYFELTSVQLNFIKSYQKI